MFKQLLIYKSTIYRTCLGTCVRACVYMHPCYQQLAFPSISASPSLIIFAFFPHTDTDPCKNVYCKYGRVCQATDDGVAQCVCAGPEFCEGHSKQVCGTDGVLYPSHCELHRKACVKGTHIGIDHEGIHCKKSAKGKSMIRSVAVGGHFRPPSDGQCGICLSVQTYPDMV